MTYHDYYSVANRWVAIADGSSYDPQLYSSRLRAEDEQIFSFGRWFEIARVVRDRKRRPMFFLFNGDRSSRSTTRQQGYVRDAIARSRLPSVTIPYTALEAAGIEPDSVRVLDATRDRWERLDHTTITMPAGARLEWRECSGWVPMELEEVYALVDKYNAQRLGGWAEKQEYVQAELDNAGVRSGEPYFWTKRYWLVKRPKPISLATWLRLHEGALRGGYGDPTTKYVVTHHRLTCWRSGVRNAEYEMEYLPDGETEYRWTTHRHWMAGSLIEGKMSWSGRTTCKWCEGSGNGIGPAYAEWYEAYGYRDTAGWRERRVRCPACDGKGARRWTRSRTAQFLSAFDSNESRPSYFFCELPPKSTATTMDEALEALKPEAVRLAEQMGREVKRQGDIFAIPLIHVTKQQLRAQGALFGRMSPLFETNHVGTEVAYLPNGPTLVRGVLHHAPAHRRPDHARVRLDGGWHVVLKNLVPISG